MPIKSDKVKDANFREPFTDFIARLESLDNEPVSKAILMTKKAQSQVAETRDTTHPRHDVMWKNAEKSWRRSPLWLLILTILRTTLHDDPSNMYIPYKSFTAFFTAQVLHYSPKKSLPSDLLSSMNANICCRLPKLDTTSALINIQY